MMWHYKALQICYKILVTNIDSYLLSLTAGLLQKAVPDRQCLGLKANILSMLTSWGYWILLMIKALSGLILCLRLIWIKCCALQSYIFLMPALRRATQHLMMNRKWCKRKKKILFFYRLMELNKIQKYLFKNVCYQKKKSYSES